METFNNKTVGIGCAGSDIGRNLTLQSNQVGILRSDNEGHGLIYQDSFLWRWNDEGERNVESKRKTNPIV
jgi:hypothetical protein